MDLLVSGYPNPHQRHFNKGLISQKPFISPPLNYIYLCSLWYDASNDLTRGPPEGRPNPFHFIWGWGGHAHVGDPQSVSLDLSYHTEHQCIWFRGGNMNSFWDIRPFMNPSWCHWMRLIIRNANICGLGVGNWTVKLQAPLTLRLQSSLHFTVLVHSIYKHIWPYYVRVKSHCLQEKQWCWHEGTYGKLFIFCLLVCDCEIFVGVPCWFLHKSVKSVMQLYKNFACQTIMAAANSLLH